MRAALAMLLAVAASAGGAAAQPVSASPPPGRVALWGSAALSFPASGSELATDYAPVLEGAVDYSSRAAQRLNIDVGGGTGVEVGFDFFPSRRVGVQAGFTFLRAGLSGSGNSDYVVHLRYVSRQPPDYAPREYTVDTSEPWTDTAGHLTTTSLLAGVVARAGEAGSRFEGTFAGGIQVSRVAAEIESVAYSSFWLGGHATLFESRSRFAATTEDAGAFVRPYVGGNVGVRLGARLLLFGGVRAQLGAQPALEVRPGRLLDSEGTPLEADLAAVQTVLTMAPLSLKQPRWRCLAGLRLYLR